MKADLLPSSKGGNYHCKCRLKWVQQRRCFCKVAGKDMQIPSVSAAQFPVPQKLWEKDWELGQED